MIPYTDLTALSDNAYKLAKLVEGGHYTNIFYYEFHEEVNPDGIYNCLEGLEEFQNRSTGTSEIFFHEGYVDEQPAVIHVALKVGDEWFIAKECGSNFYLGFGPRGILKLRDACVSRGVMGFALDERLDDWIENKFGQPRIQQEDRKNQDAGEFKVICRKLAHLTVDMQGQPQEYQGLNEENIRARMKTSFNVSFEGRVFAEAKSCKGRTDIFIQTTDKLNEHIFELKVWDGIKTLKDAIEQLQGYLAYHNNHCGIVMFSYKKSFTSVLNEVDKYLKEKYSEVDRKNENEFDFLMVHDKDEQKKVAVHLVLINLRCN